MTKVEELREKIKKGLYDGTPNISYGEEIMLKLVDSLISAAHAEGVAKGAEQERERIRAVCREFKVGDTLIINAPTLLLELSVLRPRKHGPAPKEDDNGNN